MNDKKLTVNEAVERIESGVPVKATIKTGRKKTNVVVSPTPCPSCEYRKKEDDRKRKAAEDELTAFAEHEFRRHKPGELSRAIRVSQTERRYFVFGTCGGIQIVVNFWKDYDGGYAYWRGTDIGYHCIVNPKDYEQKPITDSCSANISFGLPGTCYYDGTGLRAHELIEDRFGRKIDPFTWREDEEIFREAERYFDSWLGETEAKCAPIVAVCRALREWGRR